MAGSHRAPCFLACDAEKSVYMKPGALAVRSSSKSLSVVSSCIGFSIMPNSLLSRCSGGFSG